MDVWVAVIDADTLDETDIGVYTTEELALSAAERVSPGAAGKQGTMCSMRFRTGSAPSSGNE